MKKLLLVSALAVASLAPAMAQEIYIQNAAGENLNGKEITFSQYEVFAQGKNKQEIFINPELFIYATEDVTVNIYAEANEDVSLCTQGEDKDAQCIPGKSVSRLNVPLKGGQAYPLIFDAAITISNEEYEAGYQLPEIRAFLVAEIVNNPTSEVTMTVNMGGVSVSAGVENLGVDANNVTVAGRNLNYSVNSAAQLNVYSLSGKTVISQQVAGSGSLSLQGLSSGIYLYRLNGKKPLTGKFIIK